MLKCLEIKRYIFPTYSQTGQKYIELANASKLHLRVHFLDWEARLKEIAIPKHKCVFNLFSISV